MASAEEWLGRILAGDIPNATTIDELRAAGEGLHQDFKNGVMMADKPGRNAALREYASAFSNTDGGLLVFGVDDKTRELAPCPPIGDQDLTDWAQTTLQEVAHLLLPAPRFHVVQVEGGQALVVAFARTPQLVPMIEARRLRYFLRFHRSNQEVPERLLSDLLLGRRQQPSFHVTTLRNTPPSINGNDSGEKRISFAFTVENVSLVPADDVEVAVLGWSFAEKDAPIGPHLARYVDQTTPKGFRVTDQEWKVIRRSRQGTGNGPASIRGLGIEHFHSGGDFLLPLNTRGCRGSFAVYVCGKGQEPAWFQMTFLLQLGQDYNWNSTWVFQDLKIEPVVGRRPVLAWEAG